MPTTRPNPSIERTASGRPRTDNAPVDSGRRELTSQHTPMLRSAIALAASLLASSPSLANNCDAIRSQIEAKIKASGVGVFTLSTVDAEVKTPDRVVGTCDYGTKKIVYTAATQPPATQAKPKPSTEPILSE